MKNIFYQNVTSLPENSN